MRFIYNTMYYMKHEVSRRKIASPLPKKGFSEPKANAKKKVVEKPAKSLKSGSAKSAAVKSEIIGASKNAQPKTAAPQHKIAAKPSKTMVSPKKRILVVTKPPTSESKQNVKRNTVKIASKAADKITVSQIRKPKPAVAVKQKAVKTDSAKVKLKVAVPSAAPKARKNAPKVVAVKAVKKSLTEIKQPKTQTAKSTTAKVEKIKSVKTNDSNGKIQKKTANAVAPKTAAPKAKVNIAAAPKNSGSKPLRSNSIAAVKQIAQKIQKVKAQKTVEAVKTPLKPAKPIAAKTKTPPKTVRSKAVIEAKVSRPSARKVESAKKLKSKSEKITSTPTPKLKTVETPVEIVVLPVPKPRKKKVKPLGAAIFRGKKERYDFQVFPTDGEFEDAAAIYIISRRRVDKNKRAHHKMVCIGQTASILSDLKKHRKGKCFKQHCANAISVLREENEQKRLKIEADLKSAHQIPCPHA